MIKKISLASSLRSSGKDSGKFVKYTACSTKQLDDDLDEVAVISNAAPENVKYGSGSLTTVNGPRVVPGIITSAGPERSRIVTASGGVSIVQREYRALSTTSIPRPSLVQTPPASASTSVVSTTKSTDEQLKAEYASKQSLIETVTNKFQQATGISSGQGSGTFKRNDSRTDSRKKRRGSMAGLINRSHVNSDLEISRKIREQRKKEIKKEFERWETSTSASDKTGCNWSFVFDPSGRLCYYWSMVVSIAFLYNFWVVIYRFAFQEIKEDTMTMWFSFDYLADLIYILDIAVNFRTGYLEEGVLQKEPYKLRAYYMNCTIFYIDCLCLLPLDFLYLSIGFNSILRCFRLIKIYRFWAFLDRTERHTNYPNVFRTLSLVHYILVIFHWNACLFHIISINDGFGSRDWFMYDQQSCPGVLCNYLHTFYWSALALTTIGDLPRPRTRGEYFFLNLEVVFGLFLFATVLGHVANIVTNVSAARKEFQAKLDAVKTYMRMRRVPDHLQNKVIRWFDYLWMTQKSSDEERSVGCLPDKLKAEIAIHVHLDTLKRVEIFQNTEAGFLCELVLRLRPVLFSPGDYICRKGEVGKEMYIVNRGRLQVVNDNGKTVLATLRAGSYFGEISILNMGTAGNRRTASVRSVGYSDLFCLNKQDMWDVLKDYPAARVRLEAIAVKRLEKYRKEPLKKIAMGRSRSTPGLVESRGKVPINQMQSNRKEITSASTATLLTDDDYKLEERMLEAKAQEMNETMSNTSEGSLRNDSQVILRLQPSESGQGNLNITSSPIINQTQSQLLYPNYQSNYSPMINYDRRSPLPHTPLQLPSNQPFHFLSQPSDRVNHLSSICTISPANSISQLPVPQSVPFPCSSPLLNNEPHHMHQIVPPDQISSQDQALIAEIQRLRNRLITLETENASMTIKLNQQQWEVENRLAEIEMQICSGSVNTNTNNYGGASSSGAPGSNCSITSSGSGDDERNKESVI